MHRTYRAPRLLPSTLISLSLGAAAALSACGGDDVAVSGASLSATMSTTGTTGGTESGETAGETAVTTSAGPASATEDPTVTATEDPTVTTVAPTASETEPTSSPTDPTDATDPTDTTDPTATTEEPTSSTGGVDSELCLHLGGMDGVGELNTSFVVKVLVDSRINGYFLNADVDGAGLIGCLNEQIGEAAGCADVSYGCADMKTVHMGMGVSTVDFGDLAEDYGIALAEHQELYLELSDEDVAAVLGVLGSMAGDIVEDVDNDLTVYQRVGRKPAYTAMVGLINETDTLIDRVAKDFTINGFFLESDFIRLNTCLTRQLAGIDGPVSYGAEVDPPADDVDPGVSLDNPCAGMKIGHEGLTDPNEGDSPIAYEDFVSFLADLSGAMSSAGWSQADQDMVMAAMAPLCLDIVADANECPGNAQTILVKKGTLALDIPDDGYDGSLGSMACVSLNVIDDGINFVDRIEEIKVGINHAQVGDLVIKVRSPGGVVSTLMSRPGFDEPLDDGEGNGGDKSSMKKNFPVTLRDAGLVDAEVMGVGNVVCQDDGLCDYFPNPGAGEGLNLADFIGEPSDGLWDVCFGDAEPGQSGYVDAVTLVIGKVKFAP